MWRLLLAVGLTISLTPAFAGNYNPPVVQNVRVGLMVHDIDNLTSLEGEETGGDIALEGIFAFPVESYKWWIPYLHFGGALNIEGKTSQIYTGIHWHIPIGEHLFFEAGGGFAVHNGHLYNRAHVDNERNRVYGCRYLFREVGTIGVKLSPAVSWAVSINHMSNADSCPENDGLTSFGFFYQYNF